MDLRIAAAANVRHHASQPARLPALWQIRNVKKDKLYQKFVHSIKKVKRYRLFTFFMWENRMWKNCIISIRLRIPGVHDDT